jgi:hypothetical protein
MRLWADIHDYRTCSGKATPPACILSVRMAAAKSGTESLLTASPMTGSRYLLTSYTTDSTAGWSPTSTSLLTKAILPQCLGQG